MSEAEYLTLRQRLQNDLKAAMKTGDQVEKETIRQLMSSLKYAEIEKGGELNDSEGISLLQKQAKQRQDSIDQFRSGGRQDLVDREEAQLVVLRRYLPAQLSPDEVAALVASVIAETGAATLKDLNKVMPILIQRAAGRTDGKALSAAARTALQG